MPFLLNAGAIPVFVSQAAVQQGIEYLMKKRTGFKSSW